MTESKAVTEIRDGQTIITEIKTLYYQAQISALNSFIQIGQKLIELKDMIPHGQWAEYIKDNLDWNERKVQRFMQLAEGYADGSAYAKLISNPSFLSDLNITNALALLAIPEEEVEEFASEHVSEETTNKELAEEIKKYKEENTELAEQVESLKRDIEEAKANSSDISVEDYNNLEEKLQKAKDKLKKEKANAELKIEKARQETMTEVEDRVRGEMQQELDSAQCEIKKLKEQMENERKAAANLANEKLIEFKMFCDQWQVDFDNALTVVEEVREDDPEKAANMLSAVEQIVQYMTEAIEEVG